jgi:hypothetical protein
MRWFNILSLRFEWKVSIKVYVKTFAKEKTENVIFYKDGDTWNDSLFLIWVMK